MADGVMGKEYPDNKQRAAICSTQWKNKEKSMRDNDWLINEIKSRSKQTQFGRGILTADRYVRTLADAAGLDVCYRYGSKGTTSFDDVMRKAARTLVYSNDEMDLEEKATSTHEFKGLMEGAKEGVALPKNTLMLFRHKLSTSMEDRDKDIVHSKGLNLDPKMLLLWQHIHTMPLGPYLYTVSQDNKSVRVVSAIVDMNATTHDAAVMVDNGMGRFSHGFKAVSFEKRKDVKGKETGGFEIHEAEVMEESLVSVPANIGADMEEVLLSLIEGGKLTSPIMKSVGKTLRGHTPKQVQGIGIKYRERCGDLEREISCSSLEELKEAADSGLIDLTKEDKSDDENESRDKQGEGRVEKGTTGSPEETDGVGNEEYKSEEESTGDKEVDELEEKDVYLHFEHSFEALRNDLEYILKKKYKNSNIVATYPNYIIYKVYNSDAAVAYDDDKMCYKVGWGMSNDEYVLIGEPEEIELSIEIEKKDIEVEDEKAGRVISKKNESVIKEARDDIKAASQMEGVGRPVRALLVSAHRGLGKVLDSLGTVGEASIPQDIQTKDAMVAFIANATAEERDTMQNLLTTFSMVDKSRRIAKLYNALGG